MKKILIFDDCPIVCARVYDELLRDMPLVDVRIVSTRAEYYAAWEGSLPDRVFLDCHVGIDEYTTEEMKHALQFLCPKRVISISDGYCHLHREVGCKNFILKEEIVDEVRKIYKN